MISLLSASIFTSKVIPVYTTNLYTFKPNIKSYQKKMSTSDDLGKIENRVIFIHKTHRAALIWPKGKKPVLPMAAGKKVATK